MTKRNPLARRREDNPWAYVVPGDPSECWPWTGPRMKKSGYGRVGGHSPRRTYAHRWMYEQMYGPIPTGMTVDHECHNDDRMCRGGIACPHRLCINPEHLGLATLGENTRRGQASRAYCKRGHEFTPENTYVTPTGNRQCRECVRARRRQHRLVGVVLLAWFLAAVS